ncbi:MAG: phosphoribosyltransferase family protein, partial [Gemmatimonadaceae bacterium]
MNLAGNPDVVVLGLPRGGLPVAYEVAAALRAPLDVFVVRKLGVPGHEEFAMGAVATGGVRVLNPAVISGLDISPQLVEEVTRHERQELERRTLAYHVDGVLPVIRGATVVLVDDGIATGATMQAAVAAIRQMNAGAVVVAAPVMSRDALRDLSSISDRCECVAAPEPFGSVGAYYADFSQTSDAEVRRLLQARNGSAVPAVPATASANASPVRIPASGVELHGDLAVPAGAKGIVVFAHGSGSSRRSPRNRQVAASLNERGFATLLFDLLTEQEEHIDRVSGALRFDVMLLASRLAQATEWLSRRTDTRALPLGYFGASTGAAAALVADAGDPDVGAIVSRGGRPDLANEFLP